MDISNYLNKIIPGDSRSVRKDIAHGINIQTIATMVGLLTLYFHMKNIEKDDKSLTKFLRIDSQCLLAPLPSL